MRKFDIEQDLSFELCGEQFKMRLVKPEVLAALQDAEPPATNLLALEVMDRQIEGFLDNSNGQVERYRAMRAREDNTPSQGQLQELLLWMIEVQAARPTVQPSPSAPGRGASEATSKVE